MGKLNSNAQKMKFSIKGFFRKCDQIRRRLWIWSHLLRKSLMESFIFLAVLSIPWSSTNELTSMQNYHVKSYSHYSSYMKFLKKVAFPLRHYFWIN